MIRIITTHIELDYEKVEQHRYVSTEAVFNAQELLIEESNYTRNGNLETRKIYRYDENQHLQEEIHYNALNELTQRNSLVVNEEGWITKETTEFDNGSMIIKSHAFTDLGNALLTIVEDEKGSFCGKEVYVYDQQNNLIEQIETDSEGNEIVAQYSKYNAKGELIEDTIFHDGELNSIHVYEYDQNGNIICSSDKTELNTIAQETFYWYSKNGLITESKTVTSMGTRVECYSYDREDRIIRHSCYENNTLIFDATNFFENNQLVREEVFEKPFGSSPVHFILIHEHFEENSAGARVKINP